MPELRITKSNPALRDARGAYLRPEEWTSISDVGKSTSMDEYLRVESAYLDVALAFLEEAKVDRLVIRWDPQEVRPPAQYRNGQALTLPELRMAMQRVLREEMWARFEGEPGTFIHFGYDYYMFLGVPYDCPKSRALAAARGLFVEEWVSPLHPEAELDEDGRQVSEP